MTKKRKTVFLLLLLADLLWLAFIFSRSLKNAESSTEESGRFLEFFLRIFPWITDKIVRKTAHFTEFFILGALTGGLVLTLRKNNPLPGTIAGLCAGVTDELLQLGSGGRACMVTDMLLDAFGAACGAVLLFLIARLVLKKKKAETAE